MRPQKVVCVFFSVFVLFDIFSAGKEKQQLVRLHRSSPTTESASATMATHCLYLVQIILAKRRIHHPLPMCGADNTGYRSRQ